MKLISLNIEGRRHLEERVIPFLQKERADVVCLQEVFFNDVPLLEESLQAKGYFALAVNVDVGLPSFNQPHGMLGQVIVTRHPVRSVQHQYYAPSVAVDDLNEYLAPRLKDDDFSPNSVEIPFEIPRLVYPNASWRVLTSLEVDVDGEWYRVATTHFTWSENAQFTPKQAEDFRQLWNRVEDVGEHVLCGDFNSPRGGNLKADKATGTDLSDDVVLNVYDMLADRMSDLIPAEITTTLDGSLHRAGQLDFVVDGLFATPTYTAADVRIVDGVSDHKAIVAEIEKAIL